MKVKYPDYFTSFNLLPESDEYIPLFVKFLCMRLKIVFDDYGIALSETDKKKFRLFIKDNFGRISLKRDTRIEAMKLLTSGLAHEELPLKYFYDALDQYQQDSKSSYFESQDYKKLLADISMIMAIVDDLFDNRRIREHDYYWLEDFQREFTKQIEDVTFFDLHNTFSDGIWEHSDTEYIYIDEIEVEKITTTTLLLHKLYIGSLALAIIAGIRDILAGDTRIKKCGYSKCQSPNHYFVPSTKGGNIQRYCSPACRLKAYRKLKR